MVSWVKKFPQPDPIRPMHTPIKKYNKLSFSDRMDILTRYTGSIVAEIGKCTAKPIIRHVGYLFRFKKIVDDLTKAKTDLQLEQQKVQEAIK